MTGHASGEEVLHLESACLGYAGTPILSDVAWRVSRGEFWFMLGPNGAGKTTLLRAILGLLPTLSGRITRHPVYGSRARLGFVPQHCTLSEALPTTIREFVSLGATGGDRSRAERGADLDWALERVDLAGLADRSYWSLSGGQRQRALVARALVRRPDLLLLDEPTEGMDPGSQDEFLLTLEALQRSSATTLVFVTHRLQLAARYATHLAIVANGTLRAGSTEDIVASDALQTAFGDSEVIRLPFHELGARA